MIITASRALQIVSTHEVVKGGITELLDAVEAYAAKRREWSPKKSCGNCDEAAHFADVETVALKAIQSLSSEAITKLKTFLGVKDLWINTVEAGKPSTLKRLQ